MTVPAAIIYRHGWYDEEHDGVSLFRWMSRQAQCRLADLPPAGRAWLRLTAGHDWPAPACPVLSVLVDGRQVGQHAVRGGFTDYLFPLGEGEAAEVTLVLDRTHTVAGDPRELGIMVRAIEVIDLSRAQAPLDAGGWYEWEQHEYFPFRWMGREAKLVVPSHLVQRGRFAAVPAYTDIDDLSQVLTVSTDTQVLAEMPLLHGWHAYDFDLRAGQSDAVGGPASTLELTFRASCLLPAVWHPGDPRDLSVRVGELEVHDDKRRHLKTRTLLNAARDWFTQPSSSAPVSKAGAFDRFSPLVSANRDVDAYMPEGGEGWHGWEFQDYIPFRWLQSEGTISVPAAVRRGRRFCVFPLYSDYDDLSQVLTLSSGGHTTELRLVNGWGYYSFAVPPESNGDLQITLRANKLLPAANRHPDDDRILSVRLGPLMFHDDQARHERKRFFYENAVLNHRELMAGRTRLQSFPLDLGIDLYGKCNVKPACVYCPWDGTKQVEGEYAGVVVDETTLEEYGAFFQAARTLVNCSFGEPLLHPRLGEILELLARHDKVLEISTNGQAFTSRTVRALAGKPVLLYVSLDAASPAAYERLRNDRWHEVIAGLTFLREARRRANGLPKLNMVFMPMRANLTDLEGFFKLCRMVDADLLVLRPLNWLENPTAVADRAGYHFEYARELLSVEELEAVAEQCDEYGEKYEVLVANQFDFGRVKKPRERRMTQGADRDGHAG